MFTEGIYPIGDGLLDIEEKRLRGLLVQDDINEIYEVEQTPFARGKFAAVRRAIHKHSGVHFAAKFLKRRRRAQSSDKEIKHEIAVLMLCEGEDNIVKLNAVHETRSDTALLLELATGGELQTILDSEECLSEAQARICMREVLKALQFLHKRSIAHLDLKPQNILLNGERVEDGLKLCDFGISRVVAEGTNVREIVGTPDYVAPEVLNYEPLSLMTDIWSVGVLAYVLLSGFSPFGGDTKQETFLNISQCALTFPDKLFAGVSSAAIDFIRKALRIKPSERMSASGCLEHHWLKDECSLDRQIFLKQSSVNVNDLDCNAEDEDDNQEDALEEGEEEEEEEEEVQDISIDEEDEELSADDHHNLTNGCKMDSSDIESDFDSLTKTNTKTIQSNTTNPFLNGLMNSTNINGSSSSTSSPPITKSLNHMSSSKKLSTSPPKTNTTTTAVLNLPPTSRATTTLPMFNMQNGSTVLSTEETQPQKQREQLHLIARRQSSESNKENTFLSTKKISTTPLMNGHKKQQPTTPPTPVTSITTSTATIIIGMGSSSPEKDSSMIATNIPNGGSLVATITLPNGSEKPIMKATTSAQQCVFPDAPTTPKVIRKAPTTDTSPTSVKALVKKFQLEEGHLQAQQQQQQLQQVNGGEKHLKETQFNHQMQQPEHQSSSTHSLSNGCSRRSSLNSSANTSFNVASSSTNEMKASNQNNKPQSNAHHSNNCTTINNNNNNNINNINSSFSKETNGSNRLCPAINTRRASEPITAIHKKSTTVTVAPRHSVASAPSAVNFKSTCVFGLGCNSRSNGSVTTTLTPNNECRHSSNSTNDSSKSPNSCNGTSSSSSNSGSSSSSQASSSAAAILLSSHQQLQHHHHHHHPHHHHHGVAKNTTNNLSMDQGIIC